MTESIRFAWGRSSLGDFYAATTDRGLVGFEFEWRIEGAPRSLRERFPDGTIMLDQSGLSDVVRKLAGVVDRPGVDPGIPLDLRGSDYERKVWEILRRIPAGQTTNYGSLAAEMGTPNDARDATAAIVNNRIAILVPCHRVIRKDGGISGYRWGTRRKRALLERESPQAEFRLVFSALY